MQDLEEITSCYECKSKEIEYDYTHGDIYCRNCGLVLEDSLIDQGPEWRKFSTDYKKVRATQGKNLGFHTALRTSFNPKESSKENKNLAQRLSKAQRYAGRSKDRALTKAMILLEKLANQFEVSKPAHEEAALFYRKAIKKKLIRGRSVNSIGAACIYIASRRHGKVLDYNELEDKTDATSKEIAKYVRLIQRELKLPHKISHPFDYTTQYLSKLYSDDETKLEMQTTIDDLLEQLGDRNINNPKSAATALIYIAGILTNNWKGQTELAEVSNITEVTIRHRYKEIIKILNLDLNARPSNYKKR